MLRIVRSLTLVAAAFVISVGPAYGQGDCAQFVSGWFNGSPASGYLLGSSEVTLETGFDFYLSGTMSESFCVGTYHMQGRHDNRTDFRLKLRCDTYTIFGLF